jgi:hypothetical protein
MKNNLPSFKRGTSSTWETLNPVLKAGELAYDTSNNTIKFGDGVSKWQNLPSISSDDISGLKYIDSAIYKCA